MKIGIICFWDSLATPYLPKYENILDYLKIEYDTIFWNRTGKEHLSRKRNVLEINLKSATNIFGKMIVFLKWRRIMLKILRKNKYDYLIVLTTYPAVLLYTHLKKNYDQKFVFDIRDYSMESFAPFKKIVMNLIRLSKFTTISSKGYMRWLDSSPKIIMNHNITYQETNYIRSNILFNKKIINITFAGNIRLDKQTKGLLLNMKKATNYIFGFAGRMLEECDLIEFCRSNEISNVLITGTFENSEKPNIYKNVDMINAVYANEETNIRLADATPLPNRVYDAAVFKCPIVASKGTYLAELIEEYKIGFAINGFDKNVSEDFDDYINNFDEKIFINGCNNFLHDIMNEESYFRTNLENTFIAWQKGQGASN